jgi:hypothetical protein
MKELFLALLNTQQDSFLLHLLWLHGAFLRRQTLAVVMKKEQKISDLHRLKIPPKPIYVITNAPQSQ